MHHAPSHLNPGYGYDHSFDYGHELSYADDYHDYLDHDDELRHIPVHELARIMPEGLHLHDLFMSPCPLLGHPRVAVHDESQLDD